MEKEFNEIIELENLDELVGWNNEIVMAVLLFLTEKLNVKEDLLLKYKFDVIAYGFQGYYPVIGVIYLKDDIGSTEEIVAYEYNQLIKDITVDKLIGLCIKKKKQILRILNDIKKEI